MFNFPLQFNQQAGPAGNSKAEARIADRSADYPGKSGNLLPSFQQSQEAALMFLNTADLTEQTADTSQPPTATRGRNGKAEADRRKEQEKTEAEEAGAASKNKEAAEKREKEHVTRQEARQKSNEEFWGHYAQLITGLLVVKICQSAQNWLKRQADSGSELAVFYADPNVYYHKLTSAYADGLSTIKTLQGSYGISELPKWVAGAIAGLETTCNLIRQRIAGSTVMDMLDTDVRKEIEVRQVLDPDTDDDWRHYSSSVISNAWLSRSGN